MFSTGGAEILVSCTRTISKLWAKVILAENACGLVTDAVKGAGEGAEFAQHGISPFGQQLCREADSVIPLVFPLEWHALISVRFAVHRTGTADSAMTTIRAAAILDRMRTIAEAGVSLVLYRSAVICITLVRITAASEAKRPDTAGCQMPPHSRVPSSPGDARSELPACVR